MSGLTCRIRTRRDPRRHHVQARGFVTRDQIPADLSPETDESPDLAFTLLADMSLPLRPLDEVAIEMICNAMATGHGLVHRRRTFQRRYDRVNAAILDAARQEIGRCRPAARLRCGGVERHLLGRVLRNAGRRVQSGFLRHGLSRQHHGGGGARRLAHRLRQPRPCTPGGRGQVRDPARDACRLALPGKQDLTHVAEADGAATCRCASRQGGARR